MTLITGGMIHLRQQTWKILLWKKVFISRQIRNHSTAKNKEQCFLLFGIIMQSFLRTQKVPSLKQNSLGNRLILRLNLCCSTTFSFKRAVWCNQSAGPTNQVLIYSNRASLAEIIACIYQQLKAGTEPTLTSRLQLRHTCGSFALVRQIRVCKL